MIIKRYSSHVEYLDYAELQSLALAMLREYEMSLDYLDIEPWILVPALEEYVEMKLLIYDGEFTLFDFDSNIKLEFLAE